MDAEALNETTQMAIQTMIDMVSTWGLQVVGAIALLVIGRMVAGIVRRGVKGALARAKIDVSLIPFFASMAYYAAMAVVLIAVLNLFGIETTSLVAVIGAAGLAVGLALQGTLSNFAAGVMLLVFRPIRIGDWVEVGSQAGTVKEIGIFTTTMHTGDNIRIIMPNSRIFGDTIKNYTINPTRRIDLIMGISYDDDIQQAVDAIRGVLGNESRVLADPAPVVEVSELGDSSVNLVVRPWVNAPDYWSTRWALTRALKEGLEAAGCSIPYPQRDVHVIDLPRGDAA